MSETSENICPRCGARFVCGMQAGNSSCWCAELPALLKESRVSEEAAACFCPACLRALLEAQRNGEAAPAA